VSERTDEDLLGRLIECTCEHATIPGLVSRHESVWARNGLGVLMRVISAANYRRGEYGTETKLQFATGLELVVYGSSPVLFLETRRT
jgi:hypothetical protein